MLVYQRVKGLRKNDKKNADWTTKFPAMVLTALFHGPPLERLNHDCDLISQPPTPSVEQIIFQPPGFFEFSGEHDLV